MIPSDGSPNIRHVMPSDREAWVRMRVALWPEDAVAEHDAEAARFLQGVSRNPIAVLVADGWPAGLIGFAEISIRSYAEGCATDRVGFLEGWFVVPEHRRRGIGGALVRAAERWALAQGCREFASDALADNDESALAHRALGFTEVGMIRCFRKDLVREG
jgi:aminoglycoside 6'-N-acetyltransferase I